MTTEEKKTLVEALIPLEVLYWQIQSKPYTEISLGLQAHIIKSIDTIRKMVFVKIFVFEEK